MRMITKFEERDGGVCAGVYVPHTLHGVVEEILVYTTGPHENFTDANDRTEAFIQARERKN